MKIFHIALLSLVFILVFIWAQSSIEEAHQAAIEKASNRLELTRDTRMAQLQSELKTIYSEIRFWADSKPVSEGMSEMLIAWDALGSNPKFIAGNLYRTNNPLYPNYTVEYLKAPDGSKYSDSHESMHILLKGLTFRRGYYDVYLITNEGDIVYSVYKQDDYATNLNTGKYKETTLAKGFREVEENTNLNHVSLFDYLTYAPSNNAKSSFIQTSILNKKNKTQGILAFQLPLSFVDDIISNTSGLGKGMEILAVGSDHLLRNKINKEVISTTITSLAIDKALTGKKGVELIQDYKGIKTITAYAPFEFSQNILGKTKKNTWAMIAKQNLDEVLKPVNETLKQQAIILAALVCVSLILAWYFTRRKEDLSITDEKS